MKKNGISQFDPDRDKKKREVDFLALLVDAGIALSALNDFEALLQHFTETAMKMGACEGCSIYELEANHIRFLISRNTVIEKRGQLPVYKEILLPISTSTLAGYAAVSKTIVNIPDVYEIPHGTPFSFNNSFDKSTNYRSQSILAIPMLDPHGEVLGVVQLINHKVDNVVQPFPTYLEPYLRALSSQFGIVLRNLRIGQALRHSQIETVKKFVKASEYHDVDTGGHIERMSRFSVLLYKSIGYSESDCNVMRLGSMLHDIGKISTPDAVLKKPGKLTTDEFEVMKKHTLLGYEMLLDSESPFLQMGATIAYTHHEKWNGAGYPNNIKGAKIPIEGRVVALADVFDALCSKRCYKESWPLEKVLDEIRDCRGTHFDPDLVDVFLENIDEILKIQAEVPVEIEPTQLQTAS